MIPDEMRGRIILMVKISYSRLMIQLNITVFLGLGYTEIQRMLKQQP